MIMINRERLHTRTCQMKGDTGAYATAANDDDTGLCGE